MLVTLVIHLYLPGCGSLKEKRGRLKPFINGLRREFNLSVAEMDRQDAWRHAVVACAMIGNDRAFLDAAMQRVIHWAHAKWTDGDVLETTVEFV